MIAVLLRHPLKPGAIVSRVRGQGKRGGVAHEHSLEGIALVILDE
jgi:hypothetical protein